MQRGALKKSGSKLVTVWLPIPVADAVDQLVFKNDTDRSKYIRSALRERLARDGVLKGGACD